jgi:hypothetical protein
MDNSNSVAPEAIRQREDALYAAMIALGYSYAIGSGWNPMISRNRLL